MARFRFPQGLAIDGAGNLYVGDSFNYTIRKVTPVGEVTTLAALAGFAGSTNGTNSARFDFLPASLSTSPAISTSPTPTITPSANSRRSGRTGS